MAIDEGLHTHPSINAADGNADIRIGSNDRATSALGDGEEDM